jgi:hypothetical protein
VAVAFSNLTSGGDTTDLTSYSTASVSPGANRLLLLGVDAYIAAGSVQPPQPTISGNGLTWVLVNSVDHDAAGTDRGGTWLFRSMGASPSSGAITIDFGATTISACAWTLDDADGVDTSGTNGSGAVVQSVTASANDVTVTATLAAFSDASNAGFGFFAHEQAEGKTPGTDGVELADVTTISFCSASSQYQLATDTTCDASWTTLRRAGVVAVEVKAGVAGPVPTPPITVVTPQVVTWG